MRELPVYEEDSGSPEGHNERHRNEPDEKSEKRAPVEVIAVVRVRDRKIEERSGAEERAQRYIGDDGSNQRGNQRFVRKVISIG